MGKKQIEEAEHSSGSKHTCSALIPLIFFITRSFFEDILLDLLPYMKCLVCGYNSLNNFAASGDKSFGVNTQSSYDVHKLLERAGRTYSTTLVKVLSKAVSLKLVKDSIDLSVDGLHIPYDGKKRVKDWGTPFSTMMNRAYPGLYPLTAVDLLSNLILYAGSFVRAGAAKCKKNLGGVVAQNVMECIDLLGRAGIKVKSVVGDEGITSHELMEKLIANKTDYIFALKSNSRLKRFESWIKKWKMMAPDDERVIGLLRNVGYYSEITNLVMIKDDDRRYLYVTSFATLGAKRIWRMFCRRGNHERKHGVASTMGVKSLPSNKLFQIKGHLLACIYLNLILKLLCSELHLGEIDVETLRSTFTRPCYVRWSSGDSSREPTMCATIVANKALLKKIGKKHKIAWHGGTIRFIYYRESNAPKITINL
jgi:hypothetical protein